MPSLDVIQLLMQRRKVVEAVLSGQREKSGGRPHHCTFPLLPAGAELIGPVYILGSLAAVLLCSPKQDVFTFAGHLLLEE